MAGESGEMEGKAKRPGGDGGGERKRRKQQKAAAAGADAWERCMFRIERKNRFCNIQRCDFQAFSALSIMKTMKSSW